MNDYMNDDMGPPSPGGFLIVDDVAINIYITREVLLPYGLPIDTAEGGLEAIEKIKGGNEYDIIFMDHLMPDISGPEATEVIRSMGYMGCIVALTANAAEENEKLYIASGFNRFIVKPVEKEQIDDLVSEFIDSDLLGGDFDEDDEMDAAPSAHPAHDTYTTATNAYTTATNAYTTAPASKLSEMHELFILDAESALHTLEGIMSKYSRSEENSQFSKEDIELYEITVHGMKSALKNVNEYDASEFARELEDAAKSGDSSAISSRTEDFIDQLKEIIEAMRQ